MIKEFFGKKIGMTQIFDKEGQLFPVTLIEIEPACLLERFVRAGKELARIGCFKAKETKIAKVKKPQQGYFKKMGVPPFRVIKEVEIEEAKKKEANKAPGQEGQAKEVKKQEKKDEKNAHPFFGIEMFTAGQMVTVRAKTKGKGFTGAVKRHRVHRQPSSHGSGMHRRVGSVGASATPSKIMKNKKMPGHMGQCYAVTKNLKVLKVDKENQVIFLRGSVPGARTNLVSIIRQN